MKRGSFFARTYGDAGGRLPPLRKRYYNQMTVGADSIRPPCVSTMQNTIHIAPRPIWAFGWPAIHKKTTHCKAMDGSGAKHLTFY